jgi:FlaA1/EpsC-like NDP-sugar epimerase
MLTRLSRSLGNRQLFVIDAVLAASAPFVLYALRFESLSVPPDQLRNAIIFALVSVPARLAVYWMFGVYRTLWRFASIAEMELVVIAAIAGSLVAAAFGAGVLPAYDVITSRVPLSVLFNGGVLSVLLLAAPRLLMRMGGWHSLGLGSRKHTPRNVVIAGAGAAGQMILKEIHGNPALGLNPVGFIDDDPSRQGLRIGHLPILGTLQEVTKIAPKYRVEEVIIAMPTASGAVVRSIVQAAVDLGIKTRTMPSLGEILTGEVSVETLRSVEIQDLLRREPVRTDLHQVARLAQDRTVLVTGAGGSIGSELCRQLAVLGPSAVVLVGHGENPIFEILNELRRKHPALRIAPVIADIRDERRVREIFTAHRPFAVFHAAAHKHVPLMEENVVEAVTNNVLGTRNIVDAAIEHGVKHFVFISTDKAVHPTNVMGATKRVAEHVVRRAAQKYNKNFVAVRFGNVLGSRGSVVPTFVQQIQEGGPVTVTHPEMRRYFMTIPESVQLVLQAGAMGKGGETFMLDMGEPVRVVDLARDLIRLSGLVEGQDIEIQFTGIRPGEKLYEEMFFSDELAERTEHPKVLRGRTDTIDNWSERLINQLIHSAIAGDTPENLKAMLRLIVPDFTGDPAPAEVAMPNSGIPGLADLAAGGATSSGHPAIANPRPRSGRPEIQD